MSFNDKTLPPNRQNLSTKVFFLGFSALGRSDTYLSKKNGLQSLRKADGTTAKTCWSVPARVATAERLDYIARLRQAGPADDQDSDAVVPDPVGEHRDNVTWLCQDISVPLQSPVPRVDLWIDRAVLHFLLDESDIVGYFGNLKAALLPGGYALFAEFALSGASRCAGLPLHRYSVDELTSRLGSGFTLLRQSDYTYVNPAGDPRPYIYALYQRKQNSGLPVG